MPNTKFKGFKQVTSDYFEQLSDSQKLGYLWFVRSNIVTGETETYDGDIYLGTRHYGRQSGDVEALEDRVNRILYNSGIVDESGNTVTLSEIYLSKVEADETYVKKTTLFNETEEEENPLGILIVSGDDINDEE